MVSKKAAAGIAAGVAGVGLIIYAVTREKAPPAPPEGLANLYGRVTDADTGKPIPNVLVLATAIDRPKLPPATGIYDQGGYTDSDGRYVLENLIPARYQVTFSREHYQSISYEIVVVEGNNKFNTVMTLLAPLGLYGVVTDRETGAPLELVLVSIAAPYEQSTLTDAYGHYAFLNLEVGDYTIYFNKDNYWVERIELALTTTPYESNVGLSPVAIGEDRFVSCDVPTQVAQDAEVQTSHTAYLVARPSKLCATSLYLDIGDAPTPPEYEEMGDWFLWHWNAAKSRGYSDPLQLAQLFVNADGEYVRSGVALWGAEAAAVKLTWSYHTATFHYTYTLPKGVYPVRSQCLIISAEIEETPYGPTIRTWGQWEELWDVDTGKTLEVI